MSMSPSPKAFGCIADFQQAQKLADEFRVERLHRKLDGFADRYCQVVKQCGLAYHWSLPHCSGQASHRSRTQTQKPLHHSRIVSGCTLKVLPDSAKTC
jgi:hypothetical protein